MNHILKSTIILTIILLPLASFSMTGEQAIAKFRSRMYGMQKATGIVSWTVKSGRKFTGSFKYLKPGKIYVKFSNPSGKILVSNGKQLWVYNKGSNICGIQDLGRGHSGGIASFTKGYFAILTAQGAGGYTIKLKNNDKHYNEIIIYTNGSFFLKKAILKTKSGQAYSFTLTNVNKSANVMNSFFNFKPPPNAQIVKNPLNIR